MTDGSRSDRDREEEARRTPGRPAQDADADAAEDAAPGGAGASSGKANPAEEGRGVGSGGAPIPEIGGQRRDAAAGPGTDGTVLPGNVSRRGAPGRTER